MPRTATTAIAAGAVVLFLTPRAPEGEREKSGARSGVNGAARQGRRSRRAAVLLDAREHAGHAHATFQARVVTPPLLLPVGLLPVGR